MYVVDTPEPLTCTPETFNALLIVHHAPAVVHVVPSKLAQAFATPLPLEFFHTPDWQNSNSGEVEAIHGDIQRPGPTALRSARRGDGVIAFASCVCGPWGHKEPSIVAILIEARNYTNIVVTSGCTL